MEEMKFIFARTNAQARYFAPRPHPDPRPPPKISFFSCLCAYFVEIRVVYQSNRSGELVRRGGRDDRCSLNQGSQARGRSGFFRASRVGFLFGNVLFRSACACVRALCVRVRALCVRVRAFCGGVRACDVHAYVWCDPLPGRGVERGGVQACE